MEEKNILKSFELNDILDNIVTMILYEKNSISLTLFYLHYLMFKYKKKNIEKLINK